MENLFIKNIIEKEKPQPRLLEAMIPVLKSSGKKNKSKDTVIYDMYRGIKTLDELRYDITIFYPEMLVDEFMKTFGHYHNNFDMEISEVLEGNIWCLLQRYEDNPSTIAEVYLVEAKKNEKIISPAGFGHVTINPTSESASCSNWINKKSKSNYIPYEKLHGGCYYFTKKGNEKNKNYKKIPEIIKIKPKEIPEMGIIFDKPLIDYSGKELDFLNNPEKYKNIFTIKNCYTRA